MEVVVQVESGPHQGEVFVCDDPDTYVFGRSSQARFSMSEDRLLSREHFQIELTPPLCQLKDLGSTNGTKLNGLRVESSPLRDGDLIAAGESTFSVKVRGPELEGASKLRCRGCGIPASERVLEDSQTVPDMELTPVTDGWLCPDCEAQRNRFPRTHPDYLIERLIGTGGMGEVYLARQLTVNRQVAIKMMAGGSSIGDRAKDYFRREMMVLRDMLMPTGRSHPNIVAFFDIFSVDGQIQLIMEHVPGKNALEMLAGLSAPLPIATAARIGRQLLSALDYAHGKSYVHRDVKPSNLLVMGPPQRLQVKLSDFGLAKNFRENEGIVGLTGQGDIGGSVGFISPDHIRDFRDVREPADIYGAGATLYYLLTRQYPYLNFDPHSPEAYTIILEHPAVPLRAHRPDAPEALDRLLRKALEKQPRDRWRSAASMAEALQPFLEGAG